MDKSRLGILLVRTLLFFAVAVVLGVINGWPAYALIAVALTGGAALVQFGGWLWLRRTEQRQPVETPTVRSEFL
ncbi:hypothetical protein EIL87_03085 [Saccharopolyspora rhizosphaerae]|uniref:Uncharacterized protein n=1 Tax=Saccharopolyspora rhizosphaerae TaxID=2492662 RepID=A0A426K3E7_9PSEU|nr:hypothetical protein [Saccharopolyspora rhizosphaerae]RRO19975.1 hypothetical protein EIL87_03085 [Saccharopolyspora rhizosphaerae]